MSKLKNRQISPAKKWLLFFLIISVFFLPTFIYGLRNGQDSVIHLSWFATYKNALLQGDFYPRWLYDQQEGLGAPTFYLYPVFPSLFFTLVDQFTFQSMRPDYVLGVSAWLLALISGITCYFWIASFSNKKMALVAATFFAVAPYHMLMDFYIRGALAEYAAFIWIPLIFLGIRTVILQKSASGCLVLFAGIAGLFYTHLLTAMLIGPVAVMYTIILLATEKHRFNDASEAGKRFAILAVVGVLALGFSAFYVYPALSLRKFSNVEALHFVDISYTFIYNGIFRRDWKFPLYFRLFCIALLYFAMALMFLIYVLRNKKNQPAGANNKKMVCFWTVVVLASFVLMNGVFSFIFKAPSPYQEVQFIWRLLAVTEFACITAFASMFYLFQNENGNFNKIGKAVILIGMLAMLISAGNLVKKFRGEDFQNAELLKNPIYSLLLSPEEYLPNGTTWTSKVRPLADNIRPYRASPALAYSEDSRLNVLSTVQEKNVFIAKTESDTGGRLILKQFYFPGWVAVDEAGNQLAIAPASNALLVSVNVGPGSHVITFQRTLTRPEIIGRYVSLLSLVLLIVLCIWVRRISRKTAPSKV